MIFKGGLLEKVLDGTKTQTRRLVRDGDYTWCTPGANGTIINEVCSKTHRLRWDVGRTYAIQPGRGKTSVGRFILTEIRRERVGSISRADVQAEGILCANCEGYQSRYCDCICLFGQLWDSIHSVPETAFEENPEVWVLVFKLAASGILKVNVPT